MFEIVWVRLCYFNPLSRKVCACLRITISAFEDGSLSRERPSRNRAAFFEWGGSVLAKTGCHRCQLGPWCYLLKPWNLARPICCKWWCKPSTLEMWKSVKKAACAFDGFASSHSQDLEDSKPCSWDFLKMYLNIPTVICVHIVHWHILALLSTMYCTCL